MLDVVLISDAPDVCRPVRRIRLEPYLKVLFHGLLTRPRSFWCRSIRPPQENQPLEFVRIGTYLPDFFSGGGTAIVVSERIKEILSPFDGVQFLEVIMSRIVDFPFPTDFAKLRWEDWMQDIEDDLLALPDQRAKFGPVPRYFEVFAPRTLALVPEYQSLDQEEVSKLHIGWERVYSFVMEHLRSQQMIVYPVQDCYGLLVTAKLFESLEPFIDTRFFACLKFCARD